jgi:hypothetical protein
VQSSEFEHLTLRSLCSTNEAQKRADYSALLFWNYCALLVLAGCPKLNIRETLLRQV